MRKSILSQFRKFRGTFGKFRGTQEKWDWVVNVFSALIWYSDQQYGCNISFSTEQGPRNMNMSHFTMKNVKMLSVQQMRQTGLHIFPLPALWWIITGPHIGILCLTRPRKPEICLVVHQRWQKPFCLISQSSAELSKSSAELYPHE